jgi:hypothetical protein
VTGVATLPLQEQDDMWIVKSENRFLRRANPGATSSTRFGNRPNAPKVLVQHKLSHQIRPEILHIFLASANVRQYI